MRKPEIEWKYFTIYNCHRIIRNVCLQLGVAAHAYNPSPWEAKVGESLRVQGQRGLQSDFSASLNSILKPCLKKDKERKVDLVEVEKNW